MIKRRRISKYPLPQRVPFPIDTSNTNSTDVSTKIADGIVVSHRKIKQSSKHDHVGETGAETLILKFKHLYSEACGTVNLMKNKIHKLHNENCELKNVVSSMKVVLEESNCELRKLRMEAAAVRIKIDTDRGPHQIEKFTRTSTGRRRYEMNIEKKYSWFAESVRNSIQPWSLTEVNEMVMDATGLTRQWSQRSEKITGKGLMDMEGAMHMFHYVL